MGHDQFGIFGIWNLCDIRDDFGLLLRYGAPDDSFLVS